MAQTGYTPISIYYSATATNVPTAGNLVAGELAINTADGKLFYKDSAGVVQVIGTKGGVGSSTTTQVLYNSSGLVVGSANLTFDGTTLTANALKSATLGSPSATALTVQSAGTTAVTIDTSQNVSTAGKLLVGSSSNPFSSLLYVTGTPTSNQPIFSAYSQGGANVSGIGLYNDAASVGIWSQSGNLTFRTNGSLASGSESARFDASGNLSVGRTTTLARITAETTTDECIFAINSAGANSATMASWNNASTGNNYLHAFYVDAGASNVGNIDYNRAAGLLRYNVTSDATLKNIIGDSDGQRSLEILNTTRIRDFAWKNDTEQKTQIGVIAQELYETYKGAVSVGGDIEKTDEDGNVTTEYRPWGVDKTAFTFHLIAGWQAHEKIIQEQQALIANLTTRLTALEAK